MLEYHFSFRLNRLAGECKLMYAQFVKNPVVDIIHNWFLGANFIEGELESGFQILILPGSCGA